MMSLRWHALNATTKFGGRPITFVVLVILILAPLAFNPGYFNHDELQWLSFADVPTLHQIPWSGWLDFHIFQYRPLTFNFWLLLSHYFGYQPVLMHIVRAAFALVIALMLRVVLLRFGAGSRHASVAICVYLLLPCVVYTNAWIGTFADAFCLLSVLCALVWVCRERKPDASTIELVHDAILVAVLTAIALMSKETAILFPFALLLCATPRQNRGLLTAFVASSFVVGG